MTNDLVTITRATVKRGWTEFEPKVITGLLTGSTGAAIASVLSAFGVDVTDTMKYFIVVACYFLGSYLTPSSGMVITTSNPNGDVVTKTTGHTVTTATGAIPVQESPSAPAAPWVAGAVQNFGGADPNATQVLPGGTEGNLH